MTDLTTDLLKGLATEIVAAFQTNGIPLTDGVKMKAEEHELNPEQIKRIIEVTNQIAYLSRLGSDAANPDTRTSEFPLANYDDVMESLANDVLAIEKTASDRSSAKTDPLLLVTGIINGAGAGAGAGMEKKAGVESEPAPAQRVMSEAERHEKLMNLQRAHFAGLEKLASMRVEEENILFELQTAKMRAEAEAKSFGDETVWISKVAQVVGDNKQDLEALSRMALGHVKEAKAAHFRKFDDKEVSHVKSLHDLYKFASEHVLKRKQLEEQLEKSAEYLSKNVWNLGHEKVAFAPLIRGVAAAAKVVKGKLPGLAAGGSKVGGKAVKVGTTAMTGAEVAEIAQKSRPRQDVWKSLHG